MRIIIIVCDGSQADDEENATGSVDDDEVFALISMT